MIDYSQNQIYSRIFLSDIGIQIATQQTRVANCYIVCSVMKIILKISRLHNLFFLIYLCHTIRLCLKYWQKQTLSPKYLWGKDWGLYPYIMCYYLSIILTPLGLLLTSSDQYIGDHLYYEDVSLAKQLK